METKKNREIHFYTVLDRILPPSYLFIDCSFIYFCFSLLGSNPQILLAMTLHWNGARAAWRTLNPKEEIFMQVTEKFKRQIFMNNVMRIKNVIMYFVDMANWVDSCFEWESPVRSIVTFVLYEVSCYYSQPFWVPIILLLIFARNYIVISYLGNYSVF